MKRRNPRKRALVALLLLLCAAGGALLVFYSMEPELVVERLDVPATAPEAAGDAESTAEVPSPTQTPLAPPTEARFSVIALRPLFSPDRRPPDNPDSPVAAPGSAAAPDVVVTGIVTAGADSVAILEPLRPGPESEDSPRVARIGDEIGGWKVDSIEASRVVLVREGERVELPLIDEHDPRRPATRRRMPMPGQQRPASQAAPQATPPAPLRQPPQQPPANGARQPPNTQQQ